MLEVPSEVTSFNPSKNVRYYYILLALLHTARLIAIALVSGYYMKGMEDAVIVTEAVCTAFLYSIIFHNVLHKHHITSLIIVFVCGVVSTIISKLSNNTSLTCGLGYHVLNANGLIAYVLAFTQHENIEKWVMTYKYISPYLLLFYEGVFGVVVKVIIIAVCWCIYHCIGCDHQSNGEVCDVVKKLFDVSQLGMVTKEHGLMFFVGLALYVLATFTLHILR